MLQIANALETFRGRHRRKRPSRRAVSIACALALGATVTGAIGSSVQDARADGSAPVLSLLSAHLASGSLTWPGVNVLLQGFQVAIGYKTEPGHRNELKLLKVLVRPANSLMAVDCDTCKQKQLLDHTDKGGTAFFIFRPAQVITARTHLVVTDTGDAITADIGRYRLYGVSTKARSVYVMAQGCIAAESWPEFLNWSPWPSEFTPAFVRDQPTVPCNGRVPRGDSVRIAGPTHIPIGGSAAVAISGFASHPAVFSFMLTQSAFEQSCLPVPADAGYPPQFPRTPIVQRVDHAFSVNATVTGGSKALKSAYCAFLQTGGTFLGVPDGRVAARATKAFSVG